MLYRHIFCHYTQPRPLGFGQMVKTFFSEISHTFTIDLMVRMGIIAYVFKFIADGLKCSHIHNFVNAMFLFKKLGKPFILKKVWTI